MIKRNSFLKKIASYSVLASSTLAASKAHAQILYHKLNPPDTLPQSSSSYALDLNRDGIEDFVLLEKSDVHISTHASAFYFDAQLVKEGVGERIYSSNLNNAVLLSGQSIGGLNHWKSQNNSRLFAVELGSSGFGYHYGAVGNWKNQTGKFVGLRIKNKATGDFNYGWLRLSVYFLQNPDYLDDKGLVVVEDYAYEQTPNKPIIAGDVGNCTPAVSLGVTGHKTFPVGDSATLNVLGYRKGDLITWLRNGEIIKTDSVKSLIVKEHGLYSALVKNKDGCGQVTDSVQIRTFIPKNAPAVMDESLTVLSDLYVYNKTLFCKLISKNVDQASMIIYNELGFEVLKQNIETDNFTIPLQSLTTGIYFVQILNNGQMEGKKIFVE